MSETLTDLAVLLEQDLSRVHMTQEDLARELKLTQQAISLWKTRGRIPGRRMDEVIAILGPDSQIAKHREAFSANIRISEVSVARASGEVMPASRTQAFRERQRARQADWQEERALERAKLDEMWHMVEGLPGQTKSAVEAGKYKRRLDYVSDDVLAIYTRVSVHYSKRGNPPFIDPRPIQAACWKMAVCAKFDEHKRNHYNVYVFYQGYNPNEPDEMIERGMDAVDQDATAMGINVINLYDPIDFPRHLSAIEHGEVDPPDDWDILDQPDDDDFGF